MNSVFLVLLSLSVSGSILTLFILALRPFIKDRVSNVWQYYIWLIVVLRFLLPITPEDSLMSQMTAYVDSGGFSSLIQLAPPTFGQPVQKSEAEVSLDSDAQLQTPQADAGATDQSDLDLVRAIQENIWLVWAAGMLMMFFYKVISYNAFVRFVRIRAEAVTDTAILDIYQSEIAAAKIRRKIPLQLNDRVGSPMLVGMLKPILVIPSLAIGAENLRQIFRHELTHYKRGDVFYKWLVQTTKCLHWFNPLVYVIGKEIDQRCELSCDEAVIRHLDEAGREDYGDALIASLKSQENYSTFVISMTMSDNKERLKERLDMLINYKKKTRLISCITVLLTVVLLCGFTYTGAYAASASPVPQFDGVNSAALHANENLSTLNDTENEINQLRIDATGVNVVVELSDDNYFHYEYDQSSYELSVSDDNTSKAISVLQKDGALLDRFPSFVTIKIPNLSYEHISYIGNRSGMNLPSINANMDISINNGSCAVNLPDDYNKTCNLKLNTGSGVMRLGDNTQNLQFTLDAESANPTLPSSWPNFRYGQTYTYQFGKADAKVNVSLDTCSFVIEAD